MRECTMDKKKPLLDLRICLTFLIALLVMCNHSLFASAQAGVFSKYPNEYFVETGSYQGDGIAIALKLGYKHIYSIEIAPHYHELCKQRFSNDPRVNLFLGDSAKILYDVIKTINAPMTFWLDGHYSAGDTGKGETYSPIMQELEAIKKHPVKNHTILIDDIRYLGLVEFDYVTFEEITSKILEINPNYTFSFEHGFVSNDILVAKIVP
jgi:hypothetical protein